MVVCRRSGTGLPVGWRARPGCAPDSARLAGTDAPRPDSGRSGRQCRSSGSTRSGRASGSPPGELRGPREQGTQVGECGAELDAGGILVTVEADAGADLAVLAALVVADPVEHGPAVV